MLTLQEQRGDLRGCLYNTCITVKVELWLRFYTPAHRNPGEGCIPCGPGSTPVLLLTGCVGSVFSEGVPDTVGLLYP